MTDIIWLDENENEPRKQNFAIRQLLERAGQSPACFSVNKDGVNQTGVADSTWTLLTVGTEVFDVGGFFASNAWVPPAGKVLLTAGCYGYGTVTDGNWIGVGVRKNGVDFRSTFYGAGASLGSVPEITCIDIANGSDSYTAYVYIDVDSSTGIVHGGTHLTHFSGHWISA